MRGAASSELSQKPHEGGGTPQPTLLSIIVPFYNSAGKADRLLSTLARMTDPDVELIFIDDGSRDETLSYLRAHQSSIRVRCIILRQENKGPGGARNHGLEFASGKFVWFVDADDDINPGAIATVRRLQGGGYDFFDFAVRHFADNEGAIRPSVRGRAGALKLPEGEYSAQTVTRLALLHGIGWPTWAKILNREFLIRHAFRYPEYCVYEELPSVFWLPLIVDRFYKCSEVAYFHHEETESITRSVGRKSARFYDRLFTSACGVVLTTWFQCTPDERRRIEDKFTRIFLIRTIDLLSASGDWPIMPRVMKFYRQEADRLGIRRNPLRLVPRNQLARFGVLWLLSYLYPSQRDFFDELRFGAWGRPVSFPSSKELLRAPAGGAINRAAAI